MNEADGPAKAAETDEVDESTRLELFRHRPVRVHLAALAGGVVVAGLAYLAILFGVTDGGLEVATATGPTAVRTRRSAVVVAGMAAGGYYAFCTTRTLGGLLLNVVMIPLSATVTPLVIGLALGRLPAITVSPARTPAFIGELALMALPGLLVSFAVLALWGTLTFSSREASEQWARTHLPPRYHAGVGVDKSAGDGDDGRGGETGRDGDE